MRLLWIEQNYDAALKSFTRDITQEPQGVQDIWTFRKRWGPMKNARPPKCISV